ncbi:MAG: hypothetical protein ACOC2N_00700 [Spirochaetota bacterium]
MHDKDDILKIARMAIQEDPRISDPTSIITSIRREGLIFNRRIVLQIDGTVGSAYEIDDVERSVSHRLPNVEIENNVVPRSPRGL